MLTVARCPECGLRFSWTEIIAAAEDRLKPPDTFEFGWRHRPVHSYFVTVAWCLVPWRLWRRMPLTAKPQLGPLLAMVPLTIMCATLLTAATDLTWHEYTKINATANTGQTNFTGYPWSWSTRSAFGKQLVPLGVFAVIWTSLQVFRQTIRRYRIRQDQIARVLVHLWMSVILLSAITETVLLFATMPYQWFRGAVLPSAVWAAYDLVPTVALVASLGFAVSSYLKVRDAWVWTSLVLLLSIVFLAFVGSGLSLAYYDSFANEYWTALADWFPSFTAIAELMDVILRWWHGFG